MLTPYRPALWLLLTVSLLVCGCNTAKDLGKTLSDLAAVRAELIKKFGEQDVNLHANTSRSLTSISVVYFNSPLNQKTTEERAKRAQETAELSGSIVKIRLNKHEYTLTESQILQIQHMSDYLR